MRLVAAVVVTLVIAGIGGAPRPASAHDDDAVRRCIRPQPLPPPPPVPAPRGRLTLRTVPDADVTIDGRAVGRTPIFGHYLDGGAHVVRIRSSCGVRTERLRVREGEDVRLELRLCGRT